MCAALTMALGIGSFGDCRANSLTNFLIPFSKWKDTAIWVGRFKLGTDSPIGSTGGTCKARLPLPVISCCLAGVQCRERCCKSLHRKVDVSVKLGDFFQLPIDILAELRQ